MSLRGRGRGWCCRRGGAGCGAAGAGDAGAYRCVDQQCRYQPAFTGAGYGSFEFGA